MQTVFGVPPHSFTTTPLFVTVNFRSVTELNFYKKKYKNFDCLNSKKWGDEQISLPFHVKLKNKEILKISTEIKKFFESLNI